jgi:hypothetical protein
MNYIHTGTNEYPITEKQIRSRHPDTSFPKPFEPLPEYAQVLAGERPNHDHTQRAVEGTPVLVDGSYVQQWQLEPLSQEELEALTTERAYLERQERNRRLAACDWTQLSDAPIQDAAAWATYRQDLRDITDQPGFPWEITWPTAP